VLLHLSSLGDTRSWPAARWLELARTLEREGRGALLISGPAEAELGRALARELGTTALASHWIEQRGLRELAAAFAAAGRRGLTLVACDSGPMHLAAAHGLAVLALEGPQDAARTGPWPPERHAVLRSPSAPPCAPCLARRCRHAEGPVCMSTIGAGEVLAALAAGARTGTR
jgi:heptosyltransferase-2